MVRIVKKETKPQQAATLAPKPKKKRSNNNKNKKKLAVVDMKSTDSKDEDINEIVETMDSGDGPLDVDTVRDVLAKTTKTKPTRQTRKSTSSMRASVRDIEAAEAFHDRLRRIMDGETDDDSDDSDDVDADSDSA
eukprot:PhM_4_TR12199/c0_g1_i1/m.67116